MRIKPAVRLVLKTAAASIVMLGFLQTLAHAECTDCLKHTGQDPRLLPADNANSTHGAASGGGLWDRPLQAGTNSTTLQTGTENTTLQTGTQGALLQGGAERTGEQTTVEILIDCSQSMKEGLGGFLSDDHEPKMEAAKRVLEQTMASIPSDVNVGLRVFGQSFRNDPYIDCQQTALLVPPGMHNRRAMVERIRQIHPYGLTPLTYALEQAAADLAQFPGRKQIILISDGAETCGLDPCATIRLLTARGINMKIDIVGLGLKHDNEAKIQLNCIANQTGGKFYDSNTSAELVDNLRKITSESKISGKILTKLKSNEAQQILPPELK